MHRTQVVRSWRWSFYWSFPCPVPLLTTDPPTDWLVSSQLVGLQQTDRQRMGPSRHSQPSTEHSRESDSVVACMVRVPFEPKDVFNNKHSGMSSQHSWATLFGTTSTVINQLQRPRNVIFFAHWGMCEVSGVQLIVSDLSSSTDWWGWNTATRCEQLWMNFAERGELFIALVRPPRRWVSSRNDVTNVLFLD